MKNKSGSRIGGIVSRVINIRSWSDWERTKTLSAYLATSIVKVFIPQKAAVSETFDAARRRMNLTEDDLLKRQKSLFRICMLMLIFAFSFCIYSAYHFFFGQIMGGLLSVIMMLIALVLAFRYHFWYFQIRERKLGCSIQEWFRRGIMGAKR